MGRNYNLCFCMHIHDLWAKILERFIKLSLRNLPFVKLLLFLYAEVLVVEMKRSKCIVFGTFGKSPPFNVVSATCIKGNIRNLF